MRPCCEQAKEYRGVSNGGEEENNIIGSKVRKEKRAEEEYFCRREGWGEGFLELVRLRAPYFPYRGGKKWVKRWRSLVASEPGGKSSMRQKVQRNQEDALLLPFAALSAHRRIRHLFSTRSRNHLSRDIFYLRFNDVVPSDFTILFSFSPPLFSKWRFPSLIKGIRFEYGRLLESTMDLGSNNFHIICNICKDARETVQSSLIVYIYIVIFKLHEEYFRWIFSIFDRKMLDLDRPNRCASILLRENLIFVNGNLEFFVSHKFIDIRSFGNFL